jgi:hypothetical protein
MRQSKRRARDDFESLQTESACLCNAAARAVVAQWTVVLQGRSEPQQRSKTHYKTK